MTSPRSLGLGSQIWGSPIQPAAPHHLPRAPSQEEKKHLRIPGGHYFGGWEQQEPPWGGRGAPHTPGGSPPPPTWVLRAGVGQEEASARAVAGAAEQDGHGAPVGHQGRGSGAGVPAVGPCKRDGAVGAIGVPWGGWGQHPDLGLHLPGGLGQGAVPWAGCSGWHRPHPHSHRGHREGDRKPLAWDKTGPGPPPW